MKPIYYFFRIYDAQASGRSFKSMFDLLSHMSPTFLNLTSTSASAMDHLSKEFIDEMVGAVLRVNYGQYPEAATQFVAFVSLAAGEGGLWSISGGNKRLPEALLAASKANLHRLRVDSVEKAPGGGFKLTWPQGGESFDVVVVATPLTEGGVKLPVSVQHRPMEGIWVTLAEADGPNPAHFGGKTLQDVISVGPTWFNCIARVHPVNGEAKSSARHVYKV
jgi:hypothetical protein